MRSRALSLRVSFAPLDKVVHSKGLTPLRSIILRTIIVHVLCRQTEYDRSKCAASPADHFKWIYNYDFTLDLTLDQAACCALHLQHELNNKCITVALVLSGGVNFVLRCCE